MEQEIKNAIGLGNPELVIESFPKLEPEPTVTIYDFSSLLSKHEPPKNNDNRCSFPRLLGDKCVDCENHQENHVLHRSNNMTFTLDNRSQNKESSLTKALRQIQELNSKIQELEEQHQDYVQKQQNLIPAIAEICISPIQEVQGLRILIYRGEAACRQYLRSVLVKQSKAS
ncbi:hypothetical protein A4S05_21665 [Nostoc sp. KVJ20]|uniref:hypothetical protein n=1 Tax=Nostoc sp. KVJ20 TaxID=457944 RepID=UPI00083CC8D5|nr:hypothetical protein [Nostoc sp. KVJ20]ODH02948.1 hypothetical protein A4S05_21665 [Nostoc sp. KVJ20]